jgi:DNA-binding transcriptional LysR family regulator
MATQARLSAFVAVAETGSVRAAAKRLVVTESAVSAAVTALTREVGAPLVEKQGRGLRLTASGRTYAGYARTILGLAVEALTAARGDLDPEHGLVRLAAVTTAAEHVLPALLASFRTEHPGVELGLEVGPAERVWELMSAHEADLAIAGRPPRRLDAAVRAVRANSLVVVGAPPIEAGFDPARTTWLLRESGSGTRATCEALLAELDLDPPQLTLGANGAVVAGAIAGLGVTLVSQDAVRRALADRELVALRVRGTPLRRPWHAVTHPRTSAATRLLIEHLLGRGAPPVAAWRAPTPRGGSPARSTGRGA